MQYKWRGMRVVCIKRQGQNPFDARHYHYVPGADFMEGLADMNTRAVGSVWEARAAAYLKDKGYKIIEMNFRCRSGEIDIVARDGKYLVFAEVKYRKGEGSGSALSAISTKKQRQISRTALFYMMRHGIAETEPIRFDAVGITDGRIDLVQNAFEYCR